MNQKTLPIIALNIVKASCFIESRGQCWVIDVDLVVGGEKIVGHAFAGGGVVELIFEREPTYPPPAFLTGELVVVPDNNNSLLQLAEKQNIHPRLLERFVRNKLDRCGFTSALGFDAEAIEASAVVICPPSISLRFPHTPQISKFNRMSITPVIDGRNPSAVIVDILSANCMVNQGQIEWVVELAVSYEDFDISGYAFFERGGIRLDFHDESLSVDLSENLATELGIPVSVLRREIEEFLRPVKFSLSPFKVDNAIGLPDGKIACALAVYRGGCLEKHLVFAH